MTDDSQLLWLKFTGPELDIRSVPIYELGDTLVAMQRIIHKTFLFENERLKKRAQLTQKERKELSLQIVERRKSSDLYGLVPFVADPNVQQYLHSLVKIGLGTLAKYALKRVLSGDSNSRSGAPSIHARDVEGSVLVGAIYAETVQITNHINNIGGVETIELIPSGALNLAPVRLTADTQKYVRDIANESFRGTPDEIVGLVTRLYPNRLVAEIKLGPSRYVKVGLNEESFHFVRYQTGPEQELLFKGRPIVRLGKDLESFQEFEAESVEVHEA